MREHWQVGLTECAARTMLIRMRFPKLADLADKEAATRDRLGTTIRGNAENVIHLAATTPTFWHSGTTSAAEGLDGTWEEYVILATKRIKSLRGAAS
jgi:hypothetical protein